ncbi:hypothetical protein K488DRAFT_91764 [Vararia minispora EC-137]|uniref:Uncharacterized protein n=1 Tax=Vararia minispora EC-137 TaxID=1314806 RepID=A0ACB8Q5H2_9AGAM|nr:hypothetical protein K488DRAFT_91764 [Vararia minispora EC-137]
MRVRVRLVPPPREPEGRALYNRVKQEAQPAQSNPAFEQGYPDGATVHRGLQYRLSARTSALNLGRYFERVTYGDGNGSECCSFVRGASASWETGREMRTLGKRRKKPAPQARETGPIGQRVLSYRDIALPSSICLSAAGFFPLVVARFLTTHPFLVAAHCINTFFYIAASVVIAVPPGLTLPVIAAAFMDVPTFNSAGGG